MVVGNVFGQLGDTIMNSDSYHHAGFEGLGLKIAILDGGYKNLSYVQSIGEAPHPDSTTCYPVACSELNSSYTHGTACIEVVFDHAAKARYYILQKGIDTYSYTDLINYCIDQGVDIISISTMNLRDSWNDGTGTHAQALKAATDAGIMVFIAAGNFARYHWQGEYSDIDSDNIHEWDGVDEKNSFTLLESGKVESYLIWDNPNEDIDDWYDLHLYHDIPGTPEDTLIKSSEKGEGKFEVITYTNTSPTTKEVYLMVNKKIFTGPPPEMELFDFRHTPTLMTRFKYRDSISSIGGTSSSQEPNCIAVAAVPHRNYQSHPDSNENIISRYSSLGPTNDANLGPEVSAPTGIQVDAFTSEPFGGTSCATPNAAGAAAVFWSSQPDYDADGVRQVLLRKATLFKDWGDAGPDHTYGYGGLYLYDYYPKTEYVYLDGDNTSASDNKPWLTLQQADAHATSNSRVVILGGTHNTSSVLLNKPMVYVSLKESAIIK